MNYSTKKIKILVFGLTFIVFFSILFLVQFLSFKTEVSAATISEVEQYTDSDNLLYRTDNTIGDYSDELYNTTSSISNNGSAPFTLTVTADDPIVEIIPKDYFKQVGETIHIGKEYGFYINTYAVGNYNFKSDVMVFDITTDTDLVETIDQVIVEVRVIYQYEFIFLDENATMFTISSGSTNAVVQYSIDNDDGYVVAYPQLNVVSGGGYTYYFAIYSESTKYYLKDISFAGRLFNEQELNLHDGAYYNPSDDIGSFFTSYDYEYEGLAKERGEPIDPADAAFLVLNDISYVLGWIPGVNIIGNVLASPGFIYDNVSMGVDIYNACVPSLVEASSGKITATLYYQNRDDQIQYYDGNLTKTAAIVVNTGDNSVWYSTDHYATGYFRITHSALNGQVPNYTRFIREIGLKVVSEDESIVRSATGAHTYFLREKVDKELTFNASTNAYILPEGRNYFYFQPKISGYYIFEATGHTNAQLSLLNVSDQTSTNQNKKITAYLNANQKYYLESFLSDDGYGRFAIRVDVESFSASTEKSVSIKPNGNIYKLSFSKNAAYAFTSTNSNHYFQLYDQNLNMIASGSTTSLHHYLQKTETCYLRVCNKSTSTQSGTISFNEVSTIYENSSLYVSSYNELKLYKFKAPSNIPAGTYYSVSFYNFSGTINPKIYGVSTAVDTMSTSGCYVMNFSLSANQEIYFGASTSSSFYIKIAETENTLKWVVGGVEQSSNTVKLNRGTTTTIRLKINGYYFDGYIHGFYSDYYRYSGGALTIDADCPASDSLDRDPYIHLYAIRNDTPYTLNVFVGHKLTTSFSKYSDNYNYGFKWNTFTSVETDLIDIIYTVKTPNGSTTRTISNVRIGSSSSIQYIVETSLGYTGYADAEVLIEKLVLKQGNHQTTIYNTVAPSYQNLTDLQKQQNFTVQVLKINPYFYGGSGTSSDPYLIYCERHLRNIRRAKVSYYEYGSYVEKITANFKLMTSINLTWDNPWTPIEAKFSGTFDGNNYWLKYRVNIPSDAFTSYTNYYGFFGLISYGTVKNLEIWNSYIDGSASQHSGELVLAGTLAGYSFCGTITNVRVESSYVYCYRQNSWAGGLFGFSHGSTISNCTIVSSSVNGQGNVIGGLVGLGSSTAISNCTSSATVNWYKSGDNWEFNCAGGIAGKMNGGSITSCTFTGLVKYATTSETDSRTFKPCLAQIVGLRENGTTLSGNVCDGTVDKGKLKIVTWTTGILWWQETHSHNQYQNVSNGQCGYTI